MRVISVWNIFVFTLLVTGCGPSFDAYNYGVDGEGGGIGQGGGPVINDPGLPANANIIRNPSFSQDMTIWEDWGGSALLSAGAYSGGRSVRISGSGQGGVGQEVLFRVKTRASYLLKAQAKVAAASDIVYLGVRFFDLSNATIADQRVRITSTNFQNHQVNVTIPTGASSAKVYVWKESAGNSFTDIDDFSMVMTAPPEAPPKEAVLNNPQNLLPTGPSGSYNLVFNESFDGSGINTSYWNTGLWFNTTINNELQAYRPENVRVSGGNLSLVAENRAAQTTWGENMDYASGAITTRNKFTFTYGVIEARLRVPVGTGLHSLFQLQPNNKRSPPEITVMQGLGKNPGATGFSYKFYDINGAVKALVGSVSGVDFSDAYHLFTLEWTETKINFYVDGILKGTYTGDSILRDDAFILLSLAVGGVVPGSPSGVGFPQSMQADYVRIWQKP